MTRPAPESFVRVYRAANATEAYLVKGMLEQYGMTVRLRGEGLSSGLGELPAEVVEVEVRVPAGFRQLARQLLDEYEAGVGAADWRCAGCGENNPGGFEACWKCHGVRGRNRQE